ncbi:MAG: sulfotransferase [Cyclobacteriaceae bacterium]
MKIVNYLIEKVFQLLNRYLNHEARKNKVFCIGLHKTGTTSLANYFRRFGFSSAHSKYWNFEKSHLKKFEFFSDGGSHFDNDREFDFKSLYLNYPQAKFILQTRDTEKWIISKLKHAGWTQNSEIQPDNTDLITHDQWRHKSFLTIRRFIEHKLNYEKKVIDFFESRDPKRLIVVDITDRKSQTEAVNRVKQYLQLKSVNNISFPHSNNKKSKNLLDNDVYDFINQVLSETSPTY